VRGQFMTVKLSIGLYFYRNKHCLSSANIEGGNKISVVDISTGDEGPVESVIDGGFVELKPFAVAVITQYWPAGDVFKLLLLYWQIFLLLLHPNYLKPVLVDLLCLY